MISALSFQIWFLMSSYCLVRHREEGGRSRDSLIDLGNNISSGKTNR
jgi:hypothetical protein